MKKSATPRRSARRGGVTPAQQWLALGLLTLFVLVAVFYFGIGIEGDGVGQGG